MFKKYILLIFLGVFSMLIFSFQKADAATRTVCASGCDYTTITAAETGAIAGDTINVSTGTYNELNPTFTKALAWVAIDGNGTVTITNSSTGTYAATITGNSNTLSITGFVFDALNAKASAVNFSNSASNKTFDYCTFKNATAQDLNYGVGLSNIIIDHSTIYEPSGGSKPLAFNGTLAGLFRNGTIDYYGNAWLGLLSSNSNFSFTGNTVNIHGMSSATASIWDMNGININFTTTGNTENITTSGNYYIKGDRASTGGSITFNNNTSMNLWNMAFVRLTTPGAWTFDFQGTVTATSSTLSKPCLELIDQVTPSLTNFTIDMSVVNSANTSAVPVKLTSTGTNCGSAEISDFTIKSNVKGGYYIQVGSEGPSAGDNMLDSPNITNGAIYGYRYYNPSATDGTAHGIFVGHNVNANISKIIQYGNPYCIVLKGSPMTYASGGYFNSICVDAIKSGATAALAKGMQNVRMYNNTFVNTGSDVMRGFSAYENGSGQEGSGLQTKNNIINGYFDYAILIDNGAQTDFSSRNNVYNTANNLKFSVELSDKTWAEWKALGSNYDNTGSLSQDPLFVSSSNYYLKYNSPAIDAGTDVGLTSDYAGNPIYGAPDIGAYEYQPPHTMGTDEVDVSAGARIYGDGKFRDYGTVSGTTADLKITPLSGSFPSYGASDVRPAWMDITGVTWSNTGTRYKTWTESLTVSGLTNTIHIVGDLEANKYYNVKVDSTLGQNITGTNCTGGICKASSQGKITFTYTGTYSSHMFEVEEGDNSAPAGNSPSEDNSILAFTEYTPSIFIGNKNKVVNLSVIEQVVVRNKNIAFRGKLSNTSLRLGKVELRKDGKFIKKGRISKLGTWRIPFKDNNRQKNIPHAYQFVYYDSHSNVIEISNTYNVLIDRQKPRFTKIAKNQTKNSGDAASFGATDNDQIDYYKINFRGHKSTSANSEFIIPQNTPTGISNLAVQAVDRAGNVAKIKLRIRVR